MPWREVIDEVLHPGEVGVAARRKAELPARVVKTDVGGTTIDDFV